VSRLSRKCGTLDVSQPYEPPRPVTGIAFYLSFTHPNISTPYTVVSSRPHVTHFNLLPQGGAVCLLLVCAVTLNVHSAPTESSASPQQTASSDRYFRAHTSEILLTLKLFKWQVYEPLALTATAVLPTHAVHSAFHTIPTVTVMCSLCGTS
jgi:hypothetical protein